MSRVRVRVYDPTGVTYQGTLRNATGVQWQHPLAGEGESAGVATFSLMASDDQASLIVRDRIVKMHWHGAVRCGFRIRRVKWVLTDQGFRLDVTALQLRSLLGDARVLPEFGVRVGAGETRRFGFMSATGAWLVSGEWVAPYVIPLSSHAPWVQKKQPLGYPDGASGWMSPPADANPVGSRTWFRRAFTTTTAYKAVRLYVGADDAADVYLDGELVLQVPSAAPAAAVTAAYADVPLPVGDHVLAVELRDEYQWSGERLISQFLCCLASVTATTATDDADAVTVNTIILRSGSHPGWKVRYNQAADPGWRKAQVVKQLFTEAKTRGVRGCEALTLDFTDTLDTDGAAWSDRGDYEVQTFMDPLDRVTESIFDPSIDWDVDATTMKVQAWKRRGQNRTGPGAGRVALRLRNDLQSLSITESYDVTSSLYGRTADGMIVHQSDATAEAEAGGVVEGGMSLGSVASTATATDVLNAHLSSLGFPAHEVEPALSGNGPIPYVDYQLGDTVLCPDGQGGFLPVRVLAFTVDASGDDSAVGLDVKRGVYLDKPRLGKRVVAYPELAVDRTVSL